MNDLKVFLSLPILFKDTIKIYPPHVKDVVDNDDFLRYVQIFTLSQEDIEDLFVKNEQLTGQKNDNIPTPFYFLLNNSYHNKEYEKIVKEAFEFFIHQKVSFLYEKGVIFIGDLEKEILSLNSLEELQELLDKNTLLTNENFFEFQNLIRESCGYKQVEPPNPNEHPKIKQMKAKARLRDRIKAEKGIGVGLKDSIISICCMGIGITPLNVGEVSYAAIGDLMRRYQEKEKYDIDIKSLLAGADSKKVKPKYWIRKLDD